MYVGEDCGSAAPIQLRGTGGVRRMTNLKTPPIFVINCHDSLEEVVIKFEWGRLVCESKGFGIHNRL